MYALSLFYTHFTLWIVAEVKLERRGSGNCLWFSIWGVIPCTLCGFKGSVRHSPLKLCPFRCVFPRAVMQGRGAAESRSVAEQPLLSLLGADPAHITSPACTLRGSLHQQSRVEQNRYQIFQVVFFFFTECCLLIEQELSF